MNTNETYPIIGMSPGNSYFKDEEIRHLLKTVVERFGKTAILIADVPAISTYVAFGYPENRARRDKAIPQGNALKNRTDKMREELGYTTEQVRIIDWATEVEENSAYQKKYQSVRSLYQTSTEFQKEADATTRNVLVSSGRKIIDVDAAVKIAVHYLLSEFAFLEFAPEFLHAPKISYVYHKNWPVYEDYITGKFDGTKRPQLDFILLENPYETYNPLWTFEGENESMSVFETGILRAAFSPLGPSLLYDKRADTFSGIFYEVLERIASEEGWKIIWNEETGYGVIQEGLKQKRFDVFASTAWPTPEREKDALFSESLYESSVYAWTAENSVFHTLQSLKDDTSARIAIKEGDISDSIAKADFPQCRFVRVPQLAVILEHLAFVVEDKADATFVEPYTAETFNKISERRVVKIDEKVRTYGNCMMMDKGNDALKKILDEKIAAYKKEGYVESLIEKYTGNKKTFS